MEIRPFVPPPFAEVLFAPLVDYSVLLESLMLGATAMTNGETFAIGLDLGMTRRSM